MPAFFVDRPVFAWVVALLICLGGLLAIPFLAVAQYPIIAPPSISITTSYPGASPENLYNIAQQTAVVGMRTREGTISTDQLRHFLDSVSVPLLGFLRDTQNYVHLAAHGLTLWDVASTRFQGDREQWEPIITWVN